MNKVKIDKDVDQVLGYDSIAHVEKVLGKHHSEFDHEDGLIMLSHALHANKTKAEYLSNLGDTSFRTKWNEFINLIESYGFKQGLRYDFTHDEGKYTDEAILYYHPEKGLVIWATSYFNKSSLNCGKLYGQVKAAEKVEYETITSQWGESKGIKYTDKLKAGYNSLDRCSHDAFIDIEKGLHFNYDVREALINKIEQVGEHLEFVAEWTKKPFLWFLDYTEEKVPDYDYEAITKEKISRCPIELQNILKVYTR